MSNQRGKFVWYELMTTDPASAAQFYDAVTGLRIGATPDPQSVGVEYRHIVRDDGGSSGGVLTLTDEMRSGGALPCWMGYLHVNDVDVEVSEIVNDGGKCLLPAFDIPAGRIAMIADPQGVPIYVMTSVPSSGVPDGASDAYKRVGLQHVSWNELYTPDIEGAKAFYSSHFGFAFNDSFPMGDMGDYWFIEHGGEIIGAMMQQPPHVPVPGWNYYIRVGDIGKAADAISANGGEVRNGPMEVPGGEWIINATDPQGAPFSLVGDKGG